MLTGKKSAGGKPLLRPEQRQAFVKVAYKSETSFGGKKLPRVIQLNIKLDTNREQNGCHKYMEVYCYEDRYSLNVRSFKYAFWSL